MPLFSVRPNKLFVLYTGRAVEQPDRYNQITDLRLQAFVQSYKLCIHFWVIYSPQKGNEHEKVKKARSSVINFKKNYVLKVNFIFFSLVCLEVNNIIQFPVQFTVDTSPTMKWNVNENIQQSTVSVHYTNNNRSFFVVSERQGSQATTFIR